MSTPPKARGGILYGPRGRIQPRTDLLFIYPQARMRHHIPHGLVYLVTGPSAAGFDRGAPHALVLAWTGPEPPFGPHAFSEGLRIL